MRKGIIEKFEDIQSKEYPNTEEYSQLFGFIFESVKKGLTIDDISSDLENLEGWKKKYILENYPKATRLEHAHREMNELGIKTTSLQEPSTFFTLLHYISLSEKHTSIGNFKDKIILASDYQYSSHAYIEKDVDTYGILISNYFLMSSMLIATYFAIIFKDIREKFGPDEDFIELMTPEHLQEIFEDRPKLIDIFSEILVSAVATEQYNGILTLDSDIYKSHYYMNLLFSIRSFIINHEIGHLSRGHLEIKHVSYTGDIPVSQEILSIVQKELSGIIGEDNANSAMKYYFDKNFHNHIQEIEADEEAFITTHKIFMDLNVDPAYAWIGSVITIKLIEFFENVIFFRKLGKTHSDVSKQLFVLDILYTTSHPWSPTRLSCLGMHFNKALGLTWPLNKTEIGLKYRRQFSNIFQMVSIPFDLVYRKSIDRLMEIMHDDKDYYFKWDSTGKNLEVDAWENMPEYKRLWQERMQNNSKKD